MALRARKLSGAFEKRAPGRECCAGSGVAGRSPREGGEGDAAKMNSRLPRSRSRLSSTPLKFNGLAREILPAAQGIHPFPASPEGNG